MHTKWFKVLMSLTLVVAMLMTGMTVSFADTASDTDIPTPTPVVPTDEPTPTPVAPTEEPTPTPVAPTEEPTPTPKPLITPDASMFTLNTPSATYNGSAHTASVSANVSGIDYSANITYGDNVNAGTCNVTATITVTANDTYAAGTVKLEGQITIAPCTSFTATPSWTSMPYNGKTQSPSVTITANGATLVYGKDYTLGDYAFNPTKPGSYSDSFTGIGNYAGASATINYTITQSSDLNVTLSASSFTYNGQVQKPEVTVTGAGLTANDYTVTVPESTNAGTYTVTVEGKGNFTGTKTATYTINPCADITLSLDETDFIYNGQVQQPKLTVSALGKILTANTDYTFSIPQSTDKGEYTITATGKGNYTGTKTISYRINVNADPLTVHLSANAFTYNGQKQQPGITAVTCGKLTLKAGTDYDVTIPDSINAGSYTVSVKGKGNFSGAGTATYTINPNEGDIVVTLLDSTFVYNGKVQKPLIASVKCGSLTVPASDYTVTMPNSVDQGEYTVTVTTSANFTKDGAVTYKISPYTLTDADMSLSYTSREYDATEGYPTEIVTYLDLAPTYDVTRVTGKDIGTYSVTVTGKGNYAGSVTKTYGIIANTNPIVVTLSQNAFTYTSKGQYPTVTKVTCGSLTLTEGADFSITMPAESIYVGDYTVNVTTSQNFANNGSASYTINWLPTPGNPVRLVGKLNASTGWYYDNPAQITPASGYTIGYGIMASGLGNAYLTRGEGEHSGVVVHLMNSKGEITDAVTVPTYKQDTVAPGFNVSMKPSSPSVKVDADDLNGAIIDFYRNGKLIESIVFDAANPNLPIELGKTLMYPATYSVVVRDNAGNYSFDPKAYEYYFADSDGDGLINAFEASWGSDPALPDTDADGLNDREEYNNQTDPNAPDSDGDKVLDGDEVMNYKTDPNKADTDNDGIDDLASILADGIYGRGKNAPTALNLLLNNKANKAAAALAADAVPGALATLADNGYMTALTVNPFTQDSRTRLERGDENVNLKKGSEMVIIKADAAGSRAWGIHQPTGLLVEFSVNNRGRMDAVKAIDLCELFGVEALSGLSVMTDDNASVFVLANWDMAADKAVSDLVVIAPDAQAAWTIADSNGATRFEVSADGSKIVFSNGANVTVLDLISGNPLGTLTAEGKLMGFTAEGKIITELKGNTASVYTVNAENGALVAGEEEFYGAYFTKQPTIQDAFMKLTVKAGEHALALEDAIVFLNPNGYATARVNLNSLAYQAEGAKTSVPYAKFLQAE